MRPHILQPRRLTATRPRQHVARTGAPVRCGEGGHEGQRLRGECPSTWSLPGHQAAPSLNQEGTSVQLHSVNSVLWPPFGSVSLPVCPSVSHTTRFSRSVSFKRRRKAGSHSTPISVATTSTASGKPHDSIARGRNAGATPGAASGSWAGASSLGDHLQARGSRHPDGRRQGSHRTPRRDPPLLGVPSATKTSARPPGPLKPRGREREPLLPRPSQRRTHRPPRTLPTMSLATSSLFL